MWHILMLLRRTDSFPCAQWSCINHIILVRSKLWIGEFLGKLWLPRPHPKISQKSLAPYSCHTGSKWCYSADFMVEGKRERCATGPVKGEEQVCRILFCFVAPKLIRIESNLATLHFLNLSGMTCVTCEAVGARRVDFPWAQCVCKPFGGCYECQGATCGHQLDTIFVSFAFFCTV